MHAFLLLIPTFHPLSRLNTTLFSLQSQANPNQIKYAPIKPTPIGINVAASLVSFTVVKPDHTEECDDIGHCPKLKW